MNPATTILVLVGSLRRASINRQLAQVAIDQAPRHVRMRLFDRLAELPLYNEDIDTADVAEPVVAFRTAAAEADALLVVTPEYNGSIPGGLKNAIDWLSRPYGKSPMKDKPAAVIGASLSRYGGVWAHDEARKSLAIAGLRVIESITLSVPTKTLDGKHPAEIADLVRTLRGVVGDLTAEVPG
ncbi:NADPH-dependent FMN reductase [Mycolicibacterium pulveris]|uniref:NADPH-dependent FMN reductase n=1 Tax=Mycolicibacterium pulveris TaxID=36813 RepID=UPI003CEC5F4A